ncbi:hypothetical protein [Williamsia deligens]|uniref:DUF732 domain-containing protein n=1 Tax=Williamsia deligens TaxID=321325 RepID=A0ABW3GCT0_9NOCA|nr:hypothetical protein [Williamsia deligens]MCP2195582.1 hypothetical protein [Williamsia deligens]
MQSARTTVPALVRTAGIALAMAATAATGLGAGTAGADTDVVVVPAGPPVPVSSQEYSYTATHDLTVRADSIDLARFVADIPVPAQYRAANLALAARFDATVDAALASPGGCVQVVVDPRSRDGNLFNYGFFPVAGEYCS